MIRVAVVLLRYVYVRRLHDTVVVVAVTPQTADVVGLFHHDKVNVVGLQKKRDDKRLVEEY